MNALKKPIKKLIQNHRESYMNIRITSRKFKAKESLKEQIRGEIKSLLRFNDNILNVNVVLSYTHPKDSIKVLEIILQLPGKTIIVEQSSEEYELALGKAIDKIKKQLAKIKTVRTTRPKHEDS